MKPIDANFADIKALSKSRAFIIENTRNVDMALANRATEMRDYPFQLGSRPAGESTLSNAVWRKVVLRLAVIDAFLKRASFTFCSDREGFSNLKYVLEGQEYRSLGGIEREAERHRATLTTAEKQAQRALNTMRHEQD